MSQTNKTVLAIVTLAVAVVAIAIMVRNRADVAEAPTPSDQSASATVPVTQSSTSSKTSMEATITQATLKTSYGDIVIAFDNENTPATVANFTKLASSGFYNGTKFHRVIAGFMIQGGDPLSKDDSKQSMWGTGGPGYQFADEIKPTNNNAKGTISMANAGPNTNGSQFFINVDDNFPLNGKHTVFGHVTSGYDIVEKISRTATTPNDRPVEPVTIDSVELK